MKIITLIHHDGSERIACNGPVSDDFDVEAWFNAPQMLLLGVKHVRVDHYAERNEGLRNHILDIVTMAENELQGLRTGKSKGSRMRDCIGQWESTVRALRSYLDATKED